MTKHNSVGRCFRRIHTGILVRGGREEREWAMNINKFTQKSMEAVQNCEKLAYEYGNQQIDEQHLLYSLLTLEDSLILKLITKMGIQGDMFSNEAKQAVERLPKVSGSGQLYISSDLNKGAHKRRGRGKGHG